MQQYARAYLKRYIIEKEKAKKQHGAIEGLVATSSMLAISEARTGSELHPITRHALDYIWTQQGESGCWESWLKSNWPPYEVDDHFGVTLAVLAIELAPSDYRRTEPARLAKEKLLTYLSHHLPRTLHQKGMLLWASSETDGIMTAAQRQIVIDELFAQQRSDGGWNFVSLGPLKGAVPDEPPVWVRTDGKLQDTESSDGYATGFVVYILRQAGVAADDSRIKQAIAWLKSHQRVSGRWFTRSPRRDSMHFISNAGSSFATLALESCDLN